MTVHAFVDETKKNGLLLAAAVVAARDLTRTRSELRRLCLPGQQRVHFTSESRRRRCAIVDVIRSTAAVVDIYDATAIRNAREARAACLRQIVHDLANAGAHRLVIEQEDSMLADDRKVLYRAVHAAGAEHQLTYEHLRPRSEELLWVPDAVLWCWTHGTPWKSRVRSVVRHEWTA